MIKYVLAVLIPIAVCADTHVGTLLKAMPDGTVSPSNTVAYFEQVAQVAAQTQAALTEAAIILELATIVSNRADAVEAIIAQREGVGYLRGGVESFEPAGMVHNTNIVSSIIKFQKEVTPTNVVGHIYTYFSDDPGGMPYTRVTRNIRSTNTWDMVETENVVLDEIQIGSTLYECYRSDVFLPLSYSNAYFRVFTDVVGGGTQASAFEVVGRLKVGEYTGITATIIDGTNVHKWVGGPKVQ